jgi:hypothetical protein
MYQEDKFKGSGRALSSVLVALALVGVGSAASHLGVPRALPLLSPSHAAALASRAPTFPVGQVGARESLKRSPAFYPFKTVSRVHNGSCSQVVRRSAARVPQGFLGRLTVFRFVSVASPSSGSVTVALSSTAEAHVTRVLNSLPTTKPAFCHENELLYILAFHPRSQRKPLYRFQGWNCAAEVQVTLNGTTLPLLRDRSCSLLKVVKSLTPPSASGTRGAVAGCL